MDTATDTQVRVVLDQHEHVHVYYTTTSSSNVRRALDQLANAGDWSHGAERTNSTLWNSNRAGLVRLFRRAVELLQSGGFVVESVDASASGPRARMWLQDGLVMAVVDDLKSVEAMKSAAGVFQAAMFSAGLATPANPGHPEPSTDGIVGHSLSGAYEPADNAGDFVDALREQYWRVEYPADPVSTR